MPSVPPASEAGSPDAAGVPSPASTEQSLPDLGDVGTPARLADAVDVAPAQDQTRMTVGAPCAVQLEERGLRELRAVGTGTDDGRTVTVLVGDDGGTPVAVAVDPTTCAVVTRARLSGS